MANKPLNAFLRNLRRLVRPAESGEVTDRQLLDRFVADGDEAAFEELVRRHGGMVLGICRRLLNDVHLADDTFQAVFLVLLRKAASIRWRESIGGWLSGVAYRVALEARTNALKQKARESQVTDMITQDQADEQWQELRPILDQELQRLPEKYRAVLVLCYLEGKSNEEAAQLLGCSLSNVKVRLMRGRDRLRDRLAGRGMALSAGALAILITQRSAAAMPASLMNSLLEAAAQWTAGQTAANAGFSAATAALAEGVLRQMFMTKLKFAAILVLTTIGVLGLGTFGLVGPGEDPAAQEAQAAPMPAPTLYLYGKRWVDWTATGGYKGWVWDTGGNNYPKGYYTISWVNATTGYRMGAGANVGNDGKLPPTNTVYAGTWTVSVYRDHRTAGGKLTLVASAVLVAVE